MPYIGFSGLKKKLGAEKGVTDPGALAASIGRKKYGAKKFDHAASAGKSLKGAKPAAKSGSLGHALLRGFHGSK